MTEFAKAYVAAMRSGDTLAIGQLIHPASLACLAGDNADWFIVYPCPTLAGIRVFRQQREKMRRPPLRG